MLRAGEAAPGELFDLAKPVAEGLLVYVHLGGGALPGSVGADERPHGVDVLGAVRMVVAQQLAEHLIDQRLRLRRAARHQQPGAVAVANLRDGVRLGDAQRPERLLRRIGRPFRRSDHVADARAAAGLACRLRRQPGDGCLRHDRVQQVITPQQQAGDVRTRASPVQGVLGARLGHSQHKQHAGSQIRADCARLHAGEPPAPVRIEQLREQLAALAPVALSLGDDLGELDSAGDRDVLQNRDAGQPTAEWLDDQRCQRVTGNGDGQRAHLPVGGPVAAQPEQPGNGVAVLGDAPGEHVAERYRGLVIEHRRPGLGICQVQAKAEPTAE
jgi:hypothetical protein